MQFLEHDPEKWKPVFPRDKRGTRLRGDHAQAIGKRDSSQNNRALAVQFLCGLRD
jgi:hypothetical protein